MNKQKRAYVLILVLLLILAVTSFTPVYAEIDGELYAEANKLAKEKSVLLTKDYGVASTQYAVISEGKIILSGNAGTYSKTEDRAITKDTMYGIGSVSKMFTTTAVMQLVDQGKINLDAPVTKYLPEFKMADERYKKITVRMLLNHSSGLMGTNYGNSMFFNDPDTITHDSLLKMLEGERLKAEPGAFSVYCNDGFTLAELIVEKVSGRSFTDFIRMNITAPLGMSSTKTPQDVFDRNLLARTYMGQTDSPTPIDTIGVIGTGGIYSTAENMCKFAQIFMETPGSNQAIELLSIQSKNQMAVKEYEKGIWPEQVDSIIGYGLGWDTVDSYPFNHYNIQALVKGGDTQLYHGTMIVLPKKNMAAVVLTSGGSSAFGQILGQELLLQVLKSQGLIEEIQPYMEFKEPVKAGMPSTLIINSGLYGDGTNLKRAEIKQDGTLILTDLGATDKPAEELVYTADGVFVNPDGSKEVSFVEESNGKTYLSSLHYMNLPELGQIAITAYASQKMEPVTLSEEVKDAWVHRDGVHYYMISDKYSSQAYNSVSSLQIDLAEEAPGYVGSLTIVDEDEAVSDIQVPVMGGRDLVDYLFYEDNGEEYLRSGNIIYISEQEIEDIYTKGKSISTIKQNGYARWYRIADADVGKTITVKIPEHGSFAVYDGENCTNFSWVTGKNSVVLPEKGMIVFAGDPGVCFELSVE